MLNPNSPEDTTKTAIKHITTEI